MIREFRDFIAKGNVMDLAVGIIIGAAFTAIVNSLVADIINPIIGAIIGGVDFSNMYAVISGEPPASAGLQAARDAGANVFAYGAFITAVINFLIIAFVVFLIVIVAPVSEEVFFRGFMFAGLRRSMPLWIAAVISAVVWGSLHLTGGNVGVAIQLAVFGVILAYLYERSGSLWAPIMAHGLNNAIAFLYLVTN